MALGLAPVLLLVVACLGVGGLALAKHDVLAAVASSRGATATLKSFAPSRAYTLYFVFEVRNHPEISHAYWRLLPLRQVDVEK